MFELFLLLLIENKKLAANFIFRKFFLVKMATIRKKAFWYNYIPSPILLNDKSHSKIFSLAIKTKQKQTIPVILVDLAHFK